VGMINPMNARSSVDLPHPEGPISTVVRPSGGESETSSSAPVSPNRTVSERACNIAPRWLRNAAGKAFPATNAVQAANAVGRQAHMFVFSVGDPMKTLLAAMIALALFAPVTMLAENEPRTPTRADKRRIEKERKAKLKQREQRAKANRKVNEALGEKLEAELEKWKDKGLCGSVLVAKDGVVVFKKGYGMADRENKRENAPDTLFDIGSVTKLFTAAGILKLEMQGKLSLEDKLGKFFSFAPADKKDITLTQLLSQTGGIAREYTFDGVQNYQDRDEVMNHLMSFPCTSKPGEKFEYSNANYFIAGAVIEVASGKKYEEYMQKEIVEAAGMKSSGFCSGDNLDDKNSAMRYEDGVKKGDVTNWGFSWGQRGAGYLVASVEDMFHFSEATDWGDFLDQEAKDKWFKVVKEPYSLGWFHRKAEDGTKVQHHGGAAPGARAMFKRYPEKDMMFVLLVNSIEGQSRPEEEISSAIEKVLLAN
jgi:CubicO group peptidase (beta-lactamase class C family)